MSDAETAKEAAALRALELVQEDMKLGLGTGSTAKWFVHHLGARVKAGLKVVCTATSLETHAQAEGLGIPLRTLDELGTLDLAVDGTDEITSGLDCIKGHGAALFREKLVETCAARFVVIADDSKLSAHLGIKKTVPVEVNPFGRLTTRSRLEALGAKVSPRLAKDGTILVTDNGNHIWDCDFGPIADAAALGDRIKAVVGVCEHGLFCGMASRAFLARADGSVQELLRRM
jgi:ribose 5-phosphate isomerase A